MPYFATRREPGDERAVPSGASRKPPSREPGEGDKAPGRTKFNMGNSTYRQVRLSGHEASRRYKLPFLVGLGSRGKVRQSLMRGSFMHLIFAPKNRCTINGLFALQ